MGIDDLPELEAMEAVLSMVTVLVSMGPSLEGLGIIEDRINEVLTEHPEDETPHLTILFACQLAEHMLLAYCEATNRDPRELLQATALRVYTL